MIAQRQRRKEWRPASQRKDCRSEVVPKARRGQPQSARRSARRGLGFQHVHLQPSLSQDDGRRQPIRTRADDTRLTAHRESPEPALKCTSGSSSTFFANCANFLGELGGQRVFAFRAGESVILRWNSKALGQIGRMMKEMPYITEHLSSLRQEIADLRNLNARFAEKGGHNALDQTALELRTTRLREIKQELSNMLNRPEDPKVWWERSRRQQQA